MGERLRLITIVVAVLLSTGRAVAQEAPPRGLSRIFVQAVDTGEELSGHLLELGPSAVTILVDGARRDLPIESVLRVQTAGDRVLNGALIGAAVGAVAFALVAAEYGDDAVVSGLIGTAVWASIGASVDALIPGRTTIYRKTPRGSPGGAGPRAAIAVKLRF